MKSLLVHFLLLLGFLSCSPAGSQNAQPTPKKQWAIVIHGGAGVISKDISESVRKEYEEALKNALDTGTKLLKEGSSAIDVVESVIRLMEEDPHFNAGKGAVMTSAGEHELDASIMDGATLETGAVAGVKTVRHPISLARKVMEETPHVLLAGAGAEVFADEVEVERVENSFFTTPRRKAQLERAQQREQDQSLHNPAHSQETDTFFDYDKFGTVGCAVLDKQGNIAAGTSTGGMTNKKHGRIGDSPIIGAGTYAHNATAAISATGTGEEFIRHGVARDIAARMAYKNLSLNKAAEEVIHGVLKPGDGGIVAVSASGEIAMVFNSLGMFRAAADSDGLMTVKIWE